MGAWPSPPKPLVGDLIELRRPARQDATVLHEYAASTSGLDGTWVPLPVGAGLAACQALVSDWLAGWQGQPSRQGPAFAVVEPSGNRLIGQVGFGERGSGLVELVYGIAPDHRRKGYASDAARLCARWLRSSGLAEEVELRIGRDHLESQRVAAKAGFVQIGTVVNSVEANGETFEDLRYVWERRAETR